MVAIEQGLKGMTVVAKRTIIGDFVVVFVAVYVVNSKLAIVLRNEPALFTGVFLVE
jgi:hypothetical protein